MTQADYIRSDELAEAKIPIEQLPDLFGVSRATINRWLAAGDFTRYPYKGNEFGDAPGKAVRFGDLLDASDDSTGRWVKRTQ